MLDIPKAMDIPTNEAHTNVTVKIDRMTKVFSIPIKNDEDMISNCPTMNKGMKNKRNFVQPYLPEDTGDVFRSHRKAPSETTAGYTSREQREARMTSINPRLKNETIYLICAA
jgi:hypothetical protein